VTLEALRAQVETARAALDARLASGASREELESIEREYGSGRRSVFAELRGHIKELDPAERATGGRLVEELRRHAGSQVEAARASVTGPTVDVGPRVDLTVGGRYRRGHLHRVTQVWRELEDVFVGLGYQVADGPEVETDWYNFEALNFPPGHPARAMQDTLYVRLGEPEEVVLRTHTSPVQIRVMQQHPPPLFFVMPGRVYRRDTLDARHSPVFHQIEGLAVDRGITLGDLLGTIETFVHALFGDEIQARFLPSFFPFTEPSVEFAMTCVFCSGSGCGVCSRTGWIELGGAGMVDPNVFLAVGLDPEEYSGFAFGFGLDRLVQLLDGVDHVKTLWDGDIRFLRQL
jgi:phenylalanyl-tRNA synthetase alpha chain